MDSMKAILVGLLMFLGCGGEPIDEPEPTVSRGKATFRCGDIRCVDGQACGAWQENGPIMYVCTEPCTDDTQCSTGCCTRSGACMKLSLCVHEAYNGLRPFPQGTGPTAD